VPVRDGLVGSVSTVVAVAARAVNCQAPSGPASTWPPERVTVGQQPDDRLVAVGALPELLHLAVRDQEHRVGGLARLDDQLPRRVVPLLEPLGQCAQCVAVREAAQQLQFAQLGRDDPHLRTGLHERHPSVAAPCTTAGG